MRSDALIRRTALVIAVLALAAVGEYASAQVTQAAPEQAAITRPATPVASPAEAAKAVLQKHCTGCHRAGSVEAPASALTDLSDVAAILRDATLVHPGRPDASPLYTILLSGHSNATGKPVLTDPASAPTSDEIDRVRAWIQDASPAGANCATEPPDQFIGLAEYGAALERLRQPGGASLHDIRFLALARETGCGGPAITDAKRQAAHKLMTALAISGRPIDLPVAGDGVPLLAVRLSDLGWPASQWDELATAAGAARSTDPVLTAAYATSTPIIDVTALAAAAEAADTNFFSHDTHRDADLARLVVAGRSAVSLADAAADLALPQADLDRLLDTAATANEAAVRSLRLDVITRSAWRRLRTALTLPAPPALFQYTQPGAPEDRLTVSLWSDKADYKTGELISLTATANQACNLTIINIDVRGEAAVLYPNDSTPDNAIKAGETVRIPATLAPYQLRATDKGTETFLAICALNRKRLLGVDQDYETQRFSLLGDWRQFVKTAATHEGLIVRKDNPRRRRASRARTETSSAASTPAAVEREARTAIYLKID